MKIPDIPQFKRDYVGEFIISNIRIKNKKKIFTREWIPNPIQFTELPPKATCMAPDEKVADTVYSTIQSNGSTNLDDMKMTTYGVSEVWTKVIPNFLVCRIPNVLEAMIADDYPVKTIVYTTPSLIMRYPGEFYLTPYSYPLEPRALAVWLACFNGHTEVFLVGYDDIEHKKMVRDVTSVIKNFQDVNFIQVTKYSSPGDWLSQWNFSTMTLAEYSLHNDI